MYFKYENKIYFKYENEVCQRFDQIWITVRQQKTLMTKIKAVAVQNKKNGVEEDNTNVITNR